MLKRIKSKSWKPLALWKRANVLISKTDLGWRFKITVFIKNWGTVFSDWMRPEWELDYNKMSQEEYLERRDKAIIAEVQDILERDWKWIEYYMDMD